MTTRPRPRGRTLAAAASALLGAALLLPAAAPAQEPAEDCEIGRLADWVTPSTRFEIADENFACLQRRIEALEEERDALARRIEHLEARDTLAATVYLNRNGRVSRDERHLGPATFVLAGDRRGRPRSLELERSRIVEMCADAEGCLISLGLRGVVIDGEPVAAMFSGGPCAFHLDETENAWAVSGNCADAGLPAPTPAGAPEDGQPAWGRAGDARPFAGAAQEGRILFAFGGACLIAEAVPETRSASAAGEARFARDTSPDLFLVTAGAGWEPAGAFPAALLPLGLTHPDFECSLTVRD